MKHIKIYINEKLHVTSKSFYTCQPKTNEELYDIIIQRIKDDGPECDLNDIDVSDITDMSYLFDAALNLYVGRVFPNELFEDFNGDISQWDVSNVFNCDISKWDVSNVENMEAMFDRCKNFNCDLSRWDVSHVKNMEYMFYNCKKFKQNIDGWNVSKDVNMWDAFYGCPTQPIWYED